MTETSAVRFRPVDEDEAGSDPDPAASDPASPVGDDHDREAPAAPLRKAERDRYPLAGPILEEARSRVLRGRCSGCEARLRVRLAPDETGSIRVRCPICGNTRAVDV